MHSVYGMPLDGDGPRDEDLVQSAIVIAELLGPDSSFLSIQTTEPMTMWAQLGILKAAILSVEKELLASWEDDE